MRIRRRMTFTQSEYNALLREPWITPSYLLLIRARVAAGEWVIEGQPTPAMQPAAAQGVRA